MSKKDHISPFISETLKQNPFNTPNGYFESFEARMAEKIASQKTPDQKPIHTLVPLRKTILMAAASVTILFAIGTAFYFSRNNKTTSEKDMTLAYESSVSIELNDQELVNKLENIHNEEALKDSTRRENDEYSKHIIDYLSNENLSVNDIDQSL